MQTVERIHAAELKMRDVFHLKVDFATEKKLATAVNFVFGVW